VVSVLAWHLLVPVQVWLPGLQGVQNHHDLTAQQQTVAAQQHSIRSAWQYPMHRIHAMSHMPGASAPRQVPSGRSQLPANRCALGSRMLTAAAASRHQGCEDLLSEQHGCVEHEYSWHWLGECWRLEDTQLHAYALQHVTKHAHAVGKG
jgi:hypothetical protein